LLTLDKRILADKAGKLSAAKVREVQDGLRLVLAL
jgi:mRNA-degrading endonuclease toxin of MazEF toxin-antitoxin module